MGSHGPTIRVPRQSLDSGIKNLPPPTPALYPPGIRPKPATLAGWSTPQACRRAAQAVGLGQSRLLRTGLQASLSLFARVQTVPRRPADSLRQPVGKTARRRPKETKEEFNRR